MENSQVARAMVKITVEKESVFYMYQDILTRVSPYFKNAFEKDFFEAEEKSIRLPHVAVAVMEEFIDWLYTGNLQALEISENGKPKRDEDLAARRDQLVDLYIFGDAQDVPALRHAITDALIELYNQSNIELPGYQWTKRLCSKVPRSSTLIQFLVDSACQKFSPKEDQIRQQEAFVLKYYPIELLAALYVRLSHVSYQIRIGAMRSTYQLNPCDYHEHTSHEERDNCARKTKKKSKRN